ncbi:hypothetical protein [Curtobacterium oceanosedimentum]|nr:hypothetical protein [Curtobacterium oceanosedimentum]MCA5924262.1 hypothetical protein [Curtobacterium oceanosedimentum]
MSIDLHGSTGLDDDRSCLPKPVLTSLHDEPSASFGRWLGQINHAD